MTQLGQFARKIVRRGIKEYRLHLNCAGEMVGGGGAFGKQAHQPALQQHPGRQHVTVSHSWGHSCGLWAVAGSPRLW